MAQVRLRELYFIEDPKNRRAFLRALKEVEEEGFEIEDASLTLGKIKNIEKSTAEKRKAANAARALASESVGKTPFELQRMNNMSSKRKFTNTNAVDLKDYKYWRDEYVNGSNANDNDSKPNNFDFGEELDFPRPRRNRQPSKRPTLYDELFGDISKDHDKGKPKVDTRTDLYKSIDSLFDEEDDTVMSPEMSINSSDTIKKQKPKTALERLNEKFLANDDNKKKLEENLDSYYKHKQEKAQKELAKAKAETEKAKKETAETKKENQKLKEEAQKSKKLTVEVVAPESKPKKTRNKNVATAKKRKKKLDADIKLYRNIKFD